MQAKKDPFTSILSHETHTYIVHVRGSVTIYYKHLWQESMFYLSVFGKFELKRIFGIFVQFAFHNYF